MSSGSAKGSSSAWATVYPIVVLVSICAVAGVLLGVVHQTTEPVAQARAEQKAQEAYAQLMPEASSFEEVPCDVEGCTSALRAKDESGEDIGVVVVAQSRGYGGQVPVAVAFDMDGEVVDTMVMSNSETPGLGTKVADESYIGQYDELTARAVTASDIDLISGATISSTAALNAFNTAVEAYLEVI